jgi:hypothetical protein
MLMGKVPYQTIPHLWVTSPNKPMADTDNDVIEERGPMGQSILQCSSCISKLKTVVAEYAGMKRQNKLVLSIIPCSGKNKENTDA